jgi:hypothetical protein
MRSSFGTEGSVIENSTLENISSVKNSTVRASIMRGRANIEGSVIENTNMKIDSYTSIQFSKIRFCEIECSSSRIIGLQVKRSTVAYYHLKEYGDITDSELSNSFGERYYSNIQPVVKDSTISRSTFLGRIDVNKGIILGTYIDNRDSEDYSCMTIYDKTITNEEIRGIPGLEKYLEKKKVEKQQREKEHLEMIVSTNIYNTPINQQPRFLYEHLKPKPYDPPLFGGNQQGGQIKPPPIG